MKIYKGRSHETLSDKLNIIGFYPYREDSDLCMKDCGDLYEYISIYSDGHIVFRKYITGILRGMNTLFPLKRVGEPYTW